MCHAPHEGASRDSLHRMYRMRIHSMLVRVARAAILIFIFRSVPACFLKGRSAPTRCSSCVICTSFPMHVHCHSAMLLSLCLRMTCHSVARAAFVNSRVGDVAPASVTARVPRPTTIRFPLPGCICLCAPSQLHPALVGAALGWFVSISTSDARRV